MKLTNYILSPKSKINYVNLEKFAILPTKVCKAKHQMIHSFISHSVNRTDMELIIYT